MRTQWIQPLRHRTTTYDVAIHNNPKCTTNAHFFGTFGFLTILYTTQQQKQQQSGIFRHSISTKSLGSGTSKQRNNAGSAVCPLYIERPFKTNYVFFFENNPVRAKHFMRILYSSLNTPNDFLQHSSVGIQNDSNSLAAARKSTTAHSQSKRHKNKKNNIWQMNQSYGYGTLGDPSRLRQSV